MVSHEVESGLRLKDESITPVVIKDPVMGTTQLFSNNHIILVPRPMNDPQGVIIACFILRASPD